MKSVATVFAACNACCEFIIVLFVAITISYTQTLLRVYLIRRRRAQTKRTP